MHYLLPSTTSYTIEQREALIPNSTPDSRVVAWRSVRGARWPAYCLDAGLKATRRHDWQRAVFIEAAPVALGLIVDDVHLLPRTETEVVASFTPLGPAPTRYGHLFSSAWVSGRRVTLVFEPKALIGYLQGLGD
jgi:hypothetical protein